MGKGFFRSSNNLSALAFAFVSALFFASAAASKL